MAMFTLSHSTATHKTACTTRTTTSAAPTALSLTTTIPTNSGWAMRCGHPPCNRWLALPL